MSPRRAGAPVVLLVALALAPGGVAAPAASPDGLVIAEWSGLTDDLMGAPKRGVVTADMIERLIAAHGQP